VKTIIDSIHNNPEDWFINSYYFRHKDGVSIWIGNGLNHFELKSGGNFTKKERKKVYKAYRWWLNNAPIEKLGENL